MTTLWSLVRCGGWLCLAATLLSALPLHAATPDPSCLSGTYADLTAELAKTPISAVKVPEILPDGSITSITVPKPYAEVQPLGIRAFMADGAGPWPQTPDEKFQPIPLSVKPTAPGSTATEARISFEITSVNTAFWPKKKFLLVICEAGKFPPKYAFQFDADISSRSLSICFSLAFVVLLYLILVATVWYCSRQERKWFARFSPLNFVATDAGASLARLQILFFTFIVAGLLSYVFMRTGVLSDLSVDVLKLMGIAAAGSALGQATDIQRKRLKLKNWAWLTKKGWLPPEAEQKPKPPSWCDLLMSDGEFNVYRFQMLIFSLIVGVSLLSVGLAELATYTIPAALLGLLGLSQVVYIVGKAVAPPSVGELDDELDKLQLVEKNYIDKVADAQKDPSIAPGDPATKLAFAKLAADKEYRTYRDEVGKIYTVFKAVIPQAQPTSRLPSTANLEPDLPNAAPIVPPPPAPPP